ncbi:MAG: trypsin-like peptidase domain-containing protein [Alphaproteobacteria bacterium]|nr:trypsin-like peptidase domain-containing protein [Alphaproteobacteria bacterium]
MQRPGRRVLALAAAVVGGIVALPPPMAAFAAESFPDLSAVVAKVAPAVVAIETIATTPEGRMYFSGSGFIIEPSGIIVTNKHVIKGADEITVDVPHFPPLKAKPIYVSERIDLALLKVAAGTPLPVVKLGNSDTVKIGDRIALIGNPLGIGESVSEGVVSALNRDIRETPYDNFIQTDAALNHGNSGGVMINPAGQVVGISTGLYSSPGNTGSIGLGFAMPINDAKFIINQFLKTGKVRGGWVGVDAQRMTPQLAAGFGMKEPIGAVVSYVDPKGPAAGKILIGDVVLKVGDQDASDTRAVARLIAQQVTGAALPVVLLRDGVEKTIMVPVGEMYNDPKRAMAMLGRMPEGSMMSATPSDPGMTLAAITDENRAKFGLQPDQTGVLVTTVTPSSAAAQEKIAPGDVILAVRGQTVTTPEDVQAALKTIAAHDMHYAAMLVHAARGTHWVTLPIQSDR